MTHVVLTGFMAVGKTAVGKRLAKRLGRVFIDTDQLIEGRGGKTIAQIFEGCGESEFRRIESEVVADLEPERPAIIATGGGTFVDERNQRRLKKLGIVVCLITSPQTVCQRAGRSSKRPLADGDARERLEELYRLRMPAYRRADILVETDGLSVEQSVTRVLNMIEPRLKADTPRDGGRA